MLNETFGDFIRKVREDKNLPLRKVAAFLDIDTSTLSKVERKERPISIEYLKPLSEILEVSLKEIQIKFIKERITKDLGRLEFLCEGLNETIKYLKDQQ